MGVIKPSVYEPSYLRDPRVPGQRRSADKYMIIYGEYVKSNMYAKKYFLRNGVGSAAKGAGDGFRGVPI